eukprot:364836-Chlamydomonas_euryale.AAC.14
MTTANGNASKAIDPDGCAPHERRGGRCRQDVEKGGPVSDCVAGYREGGKGGACKHLLARASISWRMHASLGACTAHAPTIQTHRIPYRLL